MTPAAIAHFKAALAPHLAAIQALEATPKDAHQAMHRVAWEVASENGLEVSDLQGPARARLVSIPRQEAYWRIYDEVGVSQPEIGRFFNRDHTTVLAGIRAHLERVQAARKLAAKFTKQEEN